MVQSISKMLGRPLLSASAGLVLYKVKLGWEDPRISKQAETKRPSLGGRGLSSD